MIPLILVCRSKKVLVSAQGTWASHLESGILPMTKPKRRWPNWRTAMRRRWRRNRWGVSQCITRYQTFTFLLLQISGKWLTLSTGRKPGEAIVKAAHEYKATFVVMGSCGMSTIRRTLMGSVSDYVLHHAKIPIIICKQQGWPPQTWYYLQFESTTVSLVHSGMRHCWTSQWRGGTLDFVSEELLPDVIFLASLLFGGIVMHCCNGKIIN